MISVDGSNRLTSLPSLRVSPRRMRARVCCITCLTSGTIALSLSRSPSSALHDGGRALQAHGNLAGEPLGLSHHTAGGIEQLAVGALELLLALLGLGARRARDVE